MLPAFIIYPSLLYSIILLITLLTVYHFWFNSLHYVKLANALPGPKAYPIIGHLHLTIGLNPKDVAKQAFKILEQCSHLEIGKIWLGPKLLVGIRNPRDVEVVLNSHLQKSDEYSFFKPWLGDGLLISKGEKWRRHRKIIAPTFHISVLKTFVPVFNRKTFEVIERLKKLVGIELDIHIYMSSLTVDILLETAMGMKNNRRKNNNEDSGFKYAKAVMNMCDILHQRSYKLWLMWDPLFNFFDISKKQEQYLKTIHSTTRETIKLKEQEYQTKIKDINYKATYSEILKQHNREEQQLNGNLYIGKEFSQNKYKDDLDLQEENDVGEKKRLAFLDFMIEANHMPEYNLTPEEIKEEVDTIMFEGHDTTAAASSFVLSLLGIHQNIQEKVVQELQEIFQNSDRPVTFQDTTEMKYLERVILETLRLYPPVPIIARKICEDTPLPSGYVIPANTTVVVGIFAIHQYERYWPNPLVFDPDNFLPEKCQKMEYYHFIPFSAGPRSCVGRKFAMLKLKVLLANIIRQFHIKSNVREEDFQLRGDIIMKIDGGFKIVLEERSKSQKI